MKADFSRVTFRPDRHFSSVRLQQGVVQLDADANEQVDIGLHRDETTTRDLVGWSGAPMGAAGFELTVAGNGIQIGKGRMYVGGTLCESDETVAFDAQPDLLDAALPTATGRYLFYLDVWQRHITSLEQPEIHEVALGEADTATRTRTVWQVRWQPVDAGAECSDFAAPWSPSGQSTGKLRAQESPAQDLNDDCLVPPGAGFRRLENQLYRVEIHAGSGAPGGPTFKWSRDNGSVAGTLVSVEGPELKVSQPSRETERSLSGARWVEVTDDAGVLNGEPGKLVEVVAEGDVLTVTSPSSLPIPMPDADRHPVVRRWDSEGAVKVATGKFIELEDGVEVEFAAGDYRSGDYWLVPARSLTGTVLWPRAGSDPRFEPPHGIEHRYAALALFDLAGGGAWKKDGDCRNLFPAVTELTSFYYLGGDGQEAMPNLATPSALVPLALPLQVGVSNGKWPVAGATVRFEKVAGTGKLAGKNGPVTVITNAEGIASSTWEVDPTTPQQTVKAVLVNDKGAPVHLPIRFGANLSTANRVAYDPGGCAGLAEAFTVQHAIERVSKIARLYYVAGDGQQAMPGATLDPLRVVVANDCGPIKGAVVRYEVVRGDGEVGGATQVDAVAGGDGVAECQWRLGGEHLHEVTATISGGVAVVGSPATMTFRARTSLATEVAYDPKDCQAAAEATTVQEALDALCNVAGTKAEPGIRVEKLQVGDDDLDNDIDVRPEALAEGIVVLCDREVAGESVARKPVCAVALELPWPMGESERVVWGGDVVGFQTIVLGAETMPKSRAILWRPAPETAHWLSGHLRDILQEFKIDSVLARLTLKGNFIWSGGEDGRLYLDGDVFGQPDDDRTALDLPSGDGVRGGDFEMWFRVRVAETDRPVPDDERFGRPGPTPDRDRISGPDRRPMGGRRPPVDPIR